jgi:hypothetical protein
MAACKDSKDPAGDINSMRFIITAKVLDCNRSLYDLCQLLPKHLTVQIGEYPA